MGSGAAHGEEGIPFDVKDLTPHQMENMGADFMNLASVPLLNGQGVQPVEVLMVAVHKQCGKGLVLQPVQPIPLVRGVRPDTAKVAADDNIVTAAHFLLLGEIF